MLDHLRTRITAWLWDARITWRLDNEHLRPFHDAPDEVVARWAAINENSVRRYQVHGGILMARDEQTQRACTWRVVDPVVVNQPAAGVLLQENAAGHQPEIHPCTIDNVPRFADAPDLSRDQALRRWALEDAARACDAVDDGCEGEWGHAAQACAEAIRALVREI